MVLAIGRTPARTAAHKPVNNVRRRRCPKFRMNGLAQQRERVFGDSGTPKTGPGLVVQFWGLDSDRGWEGSVVLIIKLNDLVQC
jgi:hypothetical protein